MKHLSLLIMFSMVACVGSNTSFLPQTIKESKENKLLINIYSVSDKLIQINDEDFEILEVWSTFKLEKKYSNKINPDFLLLELV